MQYQQLVGASMSEPHIDEFAANFLLGVYNGSGPGLVLMLAKHYLLTLNKPVSDLQTLVAEVT